MIEFPETVRARYGLEGRHIQALCKIKLLLLMFPFLTLVFSILLGFRDHCQARSVFS